MTIDDRLLIGELRSSVKDLQEGQTKLFEKSDEVASKVDTLLGKINEGWHTPITCSLRPELAAVSREVNDLKSFKKYVLGLAAGVTAVINVAITVIKALFARGG